MSEEFILRSREPQLEIPLISVGELVYNRFLSFNPNLISIIEAESGTKLTVKELISQANSIAVALINRGITKTDRICIFSLNNIPYAILLFAAYFLGITIVPLSPTFNVFELKNEIKKSGSTIIFTSLENVTYFVDILKDENNNNIYKQIKLCVVFDGNYDKCLEFNQLLKEGENQKLEKIPFFSVDPKKDYFLLIYSSGSTGSPKCAIISHFMAVSAMTEFLSLKQLPNPIVSGQITFGHISGVMFFPFWVCCGGTYVLHGKYDEELILQSVEKYKINVLLAFPAFGHVLVEGKLVDKYDLSSLKMVYTGGAPFPGNVSKAIVDKYKVIFKEVYGMTEFFVICKFPDMEPIEYIPGNCGHISWDTRLKVIDLTTGKSLGSDIDGEICVKGSKMFSGYLNNESETKATIDSEGWLHSGDIGHYDQNERIFITDRIKNVIKVGVLTISPSEIEQFLLTHECIAEVAVVGVKHRVETQWLRAYVRVKYGKNVTAEEIKKYITDNMAYTKQLRAGVVFVDQIPRTSIGKIDRQYFKNLIKDEVIV